MSFQLALQLVTMKNRCFKKLNHKWFSKFKGTITIDSYKRFVHIFSNPQAVIYNLEEMILLNSIKDLFESVCQGVVHNEEPPSDTVNR